MDIIRVSEAQLPELARLFDLYRQFYECEPNLQLARDYIAARLQNDESIIFAASDGEQLHGFVQLYPSFCSVEAIKIYVLYDLYVDLAQRNSGLGAKLMNRAAEFATSQGARRIDLSTAHSNKPGQHLYQKLGYRIVDEEFYSYSLAL